MRDNSAIASSLKTSNDGAMSTEAPSPLGDQIKIHLADTSASLRAGNNGDQAAGHLLAALELPSKDNQLQTLKARVLEELRSTAARHQAYRNSSEVIRLLAVVCTIDYSIETLQEVARILFSYDEKLAAETVASLLLENAEPYSDDAIFAQFFLSLSRPLDPQLASDPT